MKTTSESTKNACHAQGFLFSQVVNEGCNVPEFARQFLTSSFCERDVDDWDGRFHQELFLKVVLGAANGEIFLTKDIEPLSQDLARNVGYMYRLVCEATGASSKELFAKVPFEEMVGYCKSLDYKRYEDIADEIIEGELSVATPKGHWRSWERVSFATRRPWVRVPYAPYR